MQILVHRPINVTDKWVVEVWWGGMEEGWGPVDRSDDACASLTESTRYVLCCLFYPFYVFF